MIWHLVGRPIKGHILAARPGHFGNTSFAKRIKEKIREEEKNPVSHVDLAARNRCSTSCRSSKMLPHRYPFLLVDKVMEMDDDSIIGVKNVTMNEPHFTGHFPRQPGNARRSAGGSHGTGGRHLRIEQGARSRRTTPPTS